LNYSYNTTVIGRVEVDSAKLYINSRISNIQICQFLNNRSLLQWDLHFPHTNWKYINMIKCGAEYSNHSHFKNIEGMSTINKTSSTPISLSFSRNGLWLLNTIYKNWGSIKTVICTRKATMLTSRNLERMSTCEELTLICPVLMYASLLLVVPTETFTADEPEQWAPI
jgi:hypothetical protein